MPPSPGEGPAWHKLQCLSRRVWGRRPGRTDGCQLPSRSPGARREPSRSALDGSRRHAWKSWSKVVTARCRTGSAVMSRRSSPGWRSTTSASSGSTSRSRRRPTRGWRASQVRVEITIRSKGPVIRAEAAAEDKMSALDKAVERLSAQARKAADRRRVHHGSRTPTSLAQAMAAGDHGRRRADDAGRRRATAASTRSVRSRSSATARSSCARRSHPAAPMTLDQALYEMELVGHDFYLFIDKENERAVGRLPAQGLRLRRHPADRLSARRPELTGTWSRTPRGCGSSAMISAMDQVAELIATTRAHPGRRRRRPGALPPRAHHARRCRGRHRGRRRGVRRRRGGRAGRVARCPTSILMDVRMPKRSGIEACVTIKQVAPSAKIIMLTMSDEEADLYDAIKNGASGYLLKDASIDEVAQAIRRGRRRAVADQPVDGGQAARGVQDHLARRRQAPTRSRPSSPTASSRCSTWSLAA